jgi:hypothetical protein
MIHRTFARQLVNHNEKYVFAFLLMPQFMSSYYGRFLITSLKSPALVVVSSVLSNVIEVSLRITFVLRDRFYYRIRYGTEKANELFKKVEFVNMYANCLWLEMLVEITGMNAIYSKFLN